MGPRPALSPAAGVTRNQWALLVAIFVSYIGFDFVAPFLPLYVRELGITEVGDVARWSALILGISPLLSAASGPAWGIIADRYRRKPIFEGALVCYATTYLLMMLCQNVYQLIAVRVLVGFFGGYTALSLAMITAGVPSERLGRIIALQQNAQILALVVAPAVGGFAAEWIGLRSVFLLAAIMCLGAMVLVHILYEEERGEPTVATRGAHPSFRAIFQISGLVWALLIVFLLQLLDRGFNLLVPLQVSLISAPGESIHIANGVIFSAGAITGALSATILGRLTGRQRTDVLLAVSLVGGALLTLWMGLAGSNTELAAARIAQSLFAGGATTVAYAHASRSFPASVRGTAFAVLGSASLLGSALSYPILALAAGSSLFTGFVTAAVFYFLTAILGVAATARMHAAK